MPKLTDRISLEPLSRLRQHQKSNVDWRHLIFRILIEPFTSREQALEAERLAIKTEFPKFNAVHNGKRNPFQELAKLSGDVTEKEVCVDA